MRCCVTHFTERLFIVENVVLEHCKKYSIEDFWGFCCSRCRHVAWGVWCGCPGPSKIGAFKVGLRPMHPRAAVRVEASRSLGKGWTKIHGLERGSHATGGPWWHTTDMCPASTHKLHKTTQKWYNVPYMFFIIAVALLALLLVVLFFLLRSSNSKYSFYSCCCCFSCCSSCYSCSCCCCCCCCWWWWWWCWWWWSWWYWWYCWWLCVVFVVCFGCSCGCCLFFLSFSSLRCLLSLVVLVLVQLVLSLAAAAAAVDVSMEVEDRAGQHVQQSLCQNSIDVQRCQEMSRDVYRCL